MWQLQIDNLTSRDLASLAGVTESLRAMDTWDWFFGSLEKGDAADVGAAAASIIEEAVPEEGEIHPQRATIHEWSAAHVTFLTPGGVLVTVGWDDQTSNRWLRWRFNRDSVQLASEIMTMVAVSQGTPRRIVWCQNRDGQDLIAFEAGCALAHLQLRACGDEYSAACVWDQRTEQLGV